LIVTERRGAMLLAEIPLVGLGEPRAAGATSTQEVDNYRMR
jgi:hypothetical protein